MVFVVEVYEDKTKQAVLLMETSDTQFYDVKGSDHNPHFHILGTYQMGRFLSDLNFGRKGGDRFVEIYDDVHPIRPLPKYYYIVLKRTMLIVVITDGVFRMTDNQYSKGALYGIL